MLKAVLNFNVVQCSHSLFSAPLIPASENTEAALQMGAAVYSHVLQASYAKFGAYCSFGFTT